MTCINKSWLLALGPFLGVVGALSHLGVADEPARLKRADSFLGVHLDFHAQSTDQNIGQNTTPEMVNTILDMIQPDYIQIDCKGHAGFSSYPTKVGNQAGSFVGDPLKVWREATAKRGVALYMHYSGVWDSKAVQDHPEWAVVGQDGSPDKQKTSVFGPYVDKLLIPQLIELANDYRVDGVWVDGECWATIIDYSDRAKQAFREKTGIEPIPTGPQDQHWFEWTAFHREAFRDYLRHYIGAVKRAAPDFQIASNWAFSDHMPEAVCCPVDFISGDYPHSNSIVAARYSSRFMSTQRTAWDLMAWSFSTPVGGSGWTQKSAVQLQREAACVLPQGGGFQAYYTQNRDGSVNLDKLKSMEETAKFCRARQAVSFKSKAVPQVALLCNTTAHYRHASQHNIGLFPWSVTWQRPMLNRLLENQYSVEVFSETNLIPVLSGYPLLVVCEWQHFEPDLKTAIVDYVRQGGRLLLVGQTIWSHFGEVLGDAKVIAESVDDLPLRRLDFGKGLVAVLERDVTAGDVPAQVVRSAVESLAPPLVVDVDGCRTVDVSVRTTQDGRLAVHLVNTSGNHESAGIIESIDPIGPLTVTIRVDEKPSQVTVVPSGRSVDFRYEAGAVQLTLDQVGIHDVVVVE
ncbi:MAG: alpha-L-fucosidase [Pirellulaceae bacterium]